jgi:hypothetical protein
MEFFYRKAMELRGPEDPPVDEMEFRYPGPRPQTNEQGIVMLADSVEAASRSLDKPTPKRLEGLVDAIFRARTEDGQLDGCALTFADLNHIKETFLSILGGIYHFRVKYPDQDKATGETSTPPQASVPQKQEPKEPATPPSSPPASEAIASDDTSDDVPPTSSPSASEAIASDDTSDDVPPTAQDVPAKKASPDESPAAKHDDRSHGRKPGPSNEERASLG